VSEGQPSSEEQTSAEVWEARYGEAQVWSGKPNAALVQHTGDLPARRALDLGCGEGADAIWLAEQGWDVTGVDVSATALTRAQTHAQERGVQVRWVETDLAAWQADAEYDLVTSFFLHSPVNFPRAQILHAAANAVAPGGVLLVVGHADFPPWSSHHHEDGDHEHPTFPTVSETIAEAGLAQGWDLVVAAELPRRVTGPDGQGATIHDTVVKARRTAGPAGAPAAGQ